MRLFLRILGAILLIIGTLLIVSPIGDLSEKGFHFYMIILIGLGAFLVYYGLRFILKKQ